MKKLPPPPKDPSAPPQRPPLPTYDSGHTGTSYAPPPAPPPAAAPAAPAAPAAAPGSAKLSPTDKAHHALQKGQSTLGAFFHQAAGTVQSHTQGTRAGGIGSQTSHFLDKLAHTIDGPAGQSPQVQALVTEGGQLLQNVLAQLPAVIDKKVNGHPVRQYHEWIANIRVE